MKKESSLLKLLPISLIITIILLLSSCQEAVSTSYPSKLIINNTSNSSLNIALLNFNDCTDDLTADSINRNAVYMFNIDSGSIKSKGIDNGNYAIYYNYPDILGALTENIETKEFVFKDNTIKIEINKREWSLIE